MNLTDLKKEIPFKWKVQSFNKDGNKGSCVAYIDSRDVQDLLDEVCGVEGWQDKYYQVKDTMFCSIGIKVGEDWVWKGDGGAESTNGATDAAVKLKAESSDSFKRAAVKWGIGRFLYSKDIQWVNIANKKPVRPDGSIIWDLTEWINSGSHRGGSNQTTPSKSQEYDDLGEKIPKACPAVNCQATFVYHKKWSGMKDGQKKDYDLLQCPTCAIKSWDADKNYDFING